MLLTILLCSYHVLTPFTVRYQSTDAWQNEIYLLNKSPASLTHPNAIKGIRAPLLSFTAADA